MAFFPLPSSQPEGLIVSSRGVEEALRRHPRQAHTTTLHTEGVEDTTILISILLPPPTPHHLRPNGAPEWSDG